MKLVTIFSGKGGVGKTTMSILLASWLKYEKKERVVAYDFESPESRMMNKRNTDLSLLKMKDPVLTKLSDGNDFYPMGAIKGKAQGFTEGDLRKIADSIEKAKNSGDGYMICDFPGRFEAKEAIYEITRRGLIDLIVFPVQQEDQSIASMLSVNKIIKEPGFIAHKQEQEVLCFWNMVTKNDIYKDSLKQQYEQMFAMMGIPVSKTRVRYADTVKRSASAPVFVTTTVCYPKQFMLRAFPPEQNCDYPYIENLFMEIKDRLDNNGK